MNDSKNEILRVEVQFFDGCPNSKEMITRVKEAIKQLSFEVEFSETYVETPEVANQVKFRGSPTVLANEIDLENLPKPEEGNLACRYYKNGLPSVEAIKDFFIVRYDQR